MLLSKGNVYCDIHERLFWTLVSAIHSTHLPTTVLEVGGGYWDDELRGKMFRRESFDHDELEFDFSFD
jgi:hypothetical protein